MNNIIQNIIHKFFNNSQPSTNDILFKKWLLSPKNREEKDQAISEIWDSCQNEIPDAFTLSELETFHRNNFLPGKKANFRSTIYKAAATILLPILGALFTWLILDTPQDTEQLIECFVPKGEKAKQIFLPDGSEVWVNAESILIYPNTFKGDTRTLFLNGEANFKVSRDKKRPFIVKTATLDIEALGTTFNVESYSNSTQTIATLEEGKIKVSTKDSIPHETILSPNEQFIYDRNTHSREINIVDAQSLSNWKEGQLYFKNAPFGKLVKTIERKYNVTILYDQEKYKTNKLTVKFDHDETIDEVLSILEGILQNMKYKKNNDIIFIN